MPKDQSKPKKSAPPSAPKKPEGVERIDLIDALLGLRPFLSKDETRFVLNNILVERDVATLRLTATNGHVCARVNLPWMGEREKKVRVLGWISARKISVAVASLRADLDPIVGIPCLGPAEGQFPKVDSILKPPEKAGGHPMAGFNPKYLALLAGFSSGVWGRAAKVHWPKDDESPLVATVGGVHAGLVAEIAIMPMRV